MENQPTEIVIIKTKGERAMAWIKLFFKVGIIIFILAAIFGGGTIKGSFPGSLTSSYVGKFEEEVLKKEGAPSIAWIKINGIIANYDIGLGGTEISSSDKILKMLEMSKEDATVNAIVIEINSPGGTVLDSDKIAKKIKEINGKKPIYCLLQNLAASGGYYVASQCSKIFGYDETITGSIGVIISIPNISELANKIGLSQINITSGKYKSMGDPLSPMSDDSRKIFQDMVNESYEKFINTVSTGRSLKIEDVKNLADGRIYSGKQAFNLKLIDELTGKDGLINLLGKTYGDFNILLFKVQKSPLEEIFGPFGKLSSLVFGKSENLKMQLMYILN